MQKPTRPFLWATLCTLFILSACQKNLEDSELPDTNTLNSNTLLSGVVDDDPEKVAKVPVIISQDYLSNNNHEDFLDMVSAKKPGTGGGGGGGKDRKAPSVSIASPTNSATVAGTISIQVNASDNVGVSSVTLYVDGKLAGSSSASPFNISWNSASVPNGSHTLMVTAKDAAGNTSSSSVQVNVNNVAGTDITNPTVSITSPSNGASVSGTVSINITATDNTGISSVFYSIDGVVANTKTSAPFSFSWNTGDAAAGIHSITAVAKDAAGNTSSTTISVIVNTTVIPPEPNLPSTAEIQMPPVALQGGEGSCVAFSVGYAARSVAEFYESGATSYNYSTNIFSPEFLYNQTKLTDCSSGVGVVTALNFLTTTGISTWQSMPYSSYNGCTLMPTTIQMNEAANYKINSYSKIPVADITAMKTLINNKHSLIVTFAIDQSFSLAKPGFIWRAYSGNPSISHSVAICGYDDSKHAYKIMNSWGTAWGDAGYSWIDYDFLPQAAYYYAYIIN